MNYNCDCICDILNCIDMNGRTSLQAVNFQTLVELLPQYDKETLYKHSLFCYESQLIHKILYGPNSIEFIWGISEKGKAFLDNPDHSILNSY